MITIKYTSSKTPTVQSVQIAGLKPGQCFIMTSLTTQGDYNEKDVLGFEKRYVRGMLIKHNDKENRSIVLRFGDSFNDTCFEMSQKEYVILMKLDKMEFSVNFV